MKRRAALLAALVSISLGVAACSSDDGGGRTAPSTADSTAATSTAPSYPTSTTPATEPPGTDPAAARPVLESLIDRYDTAVAAILADQRVAADAEHEAVIAYLDLFTPGSTFPQTALQFWEDEGSQGEFYRPGPRGQMYESTVQALRADSPDEVTLQVCSIKSIVIVDGAGNELSAEGGQTAGSVEAVRIDGTWLLRNLTRTSAADCPDTQSRP